MVLVLDSQPGQQEPATDSEVVTESEEDSITDEPDLEPDNEQPEDHHDQAGSQEPTCEASKSNWAADPKKALLWRFMGIPASMDSRSQESLSRDFRREVPRFAGIDFTKTWTELEREGETEGIITSMSNPLLPVPFNSP